VSAPKKRRRLLIDSRYQLGHLAVILSANVLVMLLIAVLISWFYLLFFKGNLVCDHNRLFPFYLGGIALVVMLVLSLWSLSRSRSVAGMMRKTESVLVEATEGSFPQKPLIFRKSDYFGTLAGPINTCIARMQRQDQRRAEAVRLLSALQQHLAEGDGMDRETLRASIGAIRAGLEDPLSEG
jgi:hypothetical protein